MAFVAQEIDVPDVGVGPGPFPSPGWIAGHIVVLTRLGFGIGASGADKITLLFSVDGVGPIDASNPNIMGGYSGETGSQDPGLTYATACPFYAILRYPPTFGEGTPQVGAKFYLQGTN